MRAQTLEIIWHAKEPVLSVDFHPSDPRLFATGGGDKDVKVGLTNRAMCADGDGERLSRARRTGVSCASDFVL